MTNFVFLPNPRIQFVAKDDTLTGEAYRALQGLQQNLQGQVDNLAAILAQLAELDAGVIDLAATKADKSVQVIGGASVAVNATLGDAVIPIQLVNDQDTPGASLVYGTDNNGVKGWIPFSNLNHNELNGLQGGTTDEYYHLTSAEHTKVQALPAASQPLIAFAANQFGARASTGVYEAKAITDFGLSLVDDASATAAKATLGVKSGTAVLIGGTLVVNDSAVTANSVIQLTSQADGGTPGFLRVSARTPATSFTILSSSATDTSTVGYSIIEP